jgi:dephospho-CoA kinase
MQLNDTSNTKSLSNCHPRVLAVTGGIGGGKSSASAIFQNLGVPRLDADLVARSIHQDPHHPAMEAIANAIPGCVAPDGTLSRGSLRKLFAIDNAANSELKRILKRYVMAEAERWTRAQSARYVVWESALITDEAIPCDRVLVVDASDTTRLTRIRARNSDWSDEQIRNIIAIQLPRADYLSHADDVISNDGSSADLKAQVEQLHRMYLKTWS